MFLFLFLSLTTQIWMTRSQAYPTAGPCNFVVLPYVVWVKRRDSVRHSTRQPLLQLPGCKIFSCRLAGITRSAFYL